MKKVFPRALSSKTIPYLIFYISVKLFPNFCIFIIILVKLPSLVPTLFYADIMAKI